MRPTPNSVARRMDLTRIVPIPGLRHMQSDVKRLNLDLSELAIRSFGRRIANTVRPTKVAANLFVDPRQFIDRPREEGAPARDFRELLHFRRAFRVRVIADEVEGNVDLPNPFEGMVNAVTKSSRLLSVGENHNTLAALLSLDLSRGPHHGAVKICASPIRSNRNFFLTSATSAPPFRDHFNLAVESRNSDPVLRAKHSHEAVKPTNHRIPGAPHASAAVNHEQRVECDSAGFKGADLLKLVILVDQEVVFPQRRHGIALSVVNSDIDGDERHVDSQLVFLLGCGGYCRRNCHENYR